jgi:indole-3-glycerol phosphate synthase
VDDLLNNIVAQKRIEVEELKRLYSITDLVEKIPDRPHFYTNIGHSIAKGAFFFITEFKRKSPSEGEIAGTNLKKQVASYINNGAGAISVLCDKKFFGGSYEDLHQAYKLTSKSNVPVLQKDFVIDEIQIAYGASKGASLVLLIPRILEKQRMSELFAYAESIGQDVLVEVHDKNDLDKVLHLEPRILGINNRDLDTLKISLNRSNHLINQLDYRPVLIAESGVSNNFEFEVTTKNTDALLVGTSLMRNAPKTKLYQRFKSGNKYLKACGLQTLMDIQQCKSDLIGINFSPESKRRIKDDVLSELEVKDNFVAVFKGNSLNEILEVIKKYHFNYVQVYFEDISISDIKKIPCKILLAIQVKSEFNSEKIEEIASYIDCFILDGPKAGSGEAMAEIPKDFPYPFLLAGGMNATNSHLVYDFDQCIGLDTASGIESEGKVSQEKIKEISNQLTNQLI